MVSFRGAGKLTQQIPAGLLLFPISQIVSRRAPGRRHL